MEMNDRTAKLAARRKLVQREFEGVRRDRDRASADMHERYGRPIEELERQLAELDEEITEARQGA